MPDYRTAAALLAAAGAAHAALTLQHSAAEQMARDSTPEVCVSAPADVQLPEVLNGPRDAEGFRVLAHGDW